VTGHRFRIENLWADIDRRLKRYGVPRTRETFLDYLYCDLPDTWDDEAEEQLPPDLRLIPAPAQPLGQCVCSGPHEGPVSSDETGPLPIHFITILVKAQVIDRSYPGGREWFALRYQPSTNGALYGVSVPAGRASTSSWLGLGPWGSCREWTWRWGT
jgi:hypothetical protein